MHPEILYEYFRHAIDHNKTDLGSLRGAVQDTVQIWNKMPDKVLLDVFKRKLFGGMLNVPIPPDEYIALVEYLDHFEGDGGLFEI